MGLQQNPARYAGHLSIVDRFLAGHIQPRDMKGVLAYIGLSPAEQGTDATDYSWAFERPQAAVKQPEAAAAPKQPQTAATLKVAS